jgi:hypothetical protein
MSEMWNVFWGELFRFIFRFLFELIVQIVTTVIAEIFGVVIEEMHKRLGRWTFVLLALVGLLICGIAFWLGGRG